MTEQNRHTTPHSQSTPVTPRRILFVVSASFRGGATVSFVNLVRELKKKGVDMRVVTPEHGYLCEVLERFQIPYDILPVRQIIYPMLRRDNNFIKDAVLYIPRIIKMSLQNILAVRGIKRICSSFKPDIIHSNVSVINAGFLAARSLGIPHVWHVREYVDLDFSLRPFPSDALFHQRLREESYTIAITAGVMKHHGLWEHATVIYNGIENDLNTRADNILPREARDDRFIFAGAVTEGKGVGDLLKAFALYRMRGGSASLRIMGRVTPADLRHYQQVCRHLDIEDAVELAGPSDRVREEMHHALAIIVPSKCEAFGRITAEAMLSGCLVIGRDTGGTREQFNRGEELCGSDIGLRFSDETSMVEAMLAASAMSADEYEKITGDAREVTQRLYSTEKNGRLTLEFYRSILRGRLRE